VTDVIESETGVDLILDLPGVSQDQLDLIVEQDTLTVTGHRDFDIDGTAVYRESRTGEYRRVFSIGQDMDTEHITADLKDGVLRIHIPKAAKARPRRIDITGI
jgi:HSP20 family molecular chaperone IbpA